MSIKKWFYKNGIGSVGQSAKSTCVVHNSVIASRKTYDDYEFTYEYTFERIMEVKKLAWLKMNIKSSIESDVYVSFSNGCLALLAFEIAYTESWALRNCDPKDFFIVLQVIYEVVQERNYSSVKLSFSEFAENAVSFSNIYNILN